MEPINIYQSIEPEEVSGLMEVGAVDQETFLGDLFDTSDILQVKPMTSTAKQMDPNRHHWRVVIIDAGGGTKGLYLVKKDPNTDWKF